MFTNKWKIAALVLLVLFIISVALNLLLYYDQPKTQLTFSQAKDLAKSYSNLSDNDRALAILNLVPKKNLISLNRSAAGGNCGISLNHAKYYFQRMADVISPYLEGFEGRPDPNDIFDLEDRGFVQSGDFERFQAYMAAMDEMINNLDRDGCDYLVGNFIINQVPR
jgi:hypothetical protein